MNKFKLSLLTSLLVAATAAPALAESSENHRYVQAPKAKPYKVTPNTSGKVVASYFPDWRLQGDVYTVRNIPVKNLTHVIYAFLSMCAPHNYVNDGLKKMLEENCKGKEPFTATIVDTEAALDVRFDKKPEKQEYYGHFGELKKIHQQNPDLVILPSFGGWTMSEPFRAMAKSEEGRKTFVKTAVELIAKYDFFGGIDIDWEYPGGEDNSHVSWRGNSLTEEEKAHEREVFTLLMKELRAELDKLSEKTGRKYELSAAVNGTPSKVANIDFAEAQKYMDHVYAMTYDFFGGWGPQVGHLTNLHSTKDTLWGMGVDTMLKTLENAGVPKNKLVVGAAFYGRGWEGAKWEDQAKFPESGTEGKAHASDTGEAGYFSYKEIMNKFVDQNGYQYGYDEEAEAAYVYNKNTGAFISFDDPRSIEAKGKFVVDQGYGGIFSWEITQDDGTLLRAMNKGLGHKTK
ncbi:glycoside hydrolase family 18 protein [Motilimonas eburnea]|uniref:glycoside hydrolase family 18 protein n=1 Tax=Motilimonas eburnea TaxID=1737488 RepID=UPI001E3AC83E|nr:glycoside hydrolase family 18 protein [Motilimonas eburnea]MCE2572408.1 glycoside hydrolase family 18 protein [Motilimonas eburnea]